MTTDVCEEQIAMPERHPNHELNRAHTTLAALGCDAALLSSLANVTYVSGYAELLASL
jgi:hypothetical protein